jgi:Tfp pilus assembly protein PilO
MRCPERQQLIIIGAAVLIVSGFGAGRFYPLSRASAKVKSARASQEIAALKADQYRTMLPALGERAELLKSATWEFDIRIPESRQFADLWEQIADVMNRHDLKGQIVQPGSEIAGEDINCIPITIECSGSMSQIFDMLKSLGSFERMIRLEKLDIVNDGEFSGEVKLTAEAKVYYRNAGAKNI